jgi:hypothetical protein
MTPSQTFTIGYLIKKRKQLIAEWVESSVSPVSVHIQAAAIQVFHMKKIDIKNPMEIVIDPEILYEIKPVVKFIYDETQSALLKRGVRSIKLFRGINKDNALVGPLQSYTENYQVAMCYDDYDVLEDTIPIRQVLMYHKGPGWSDGSRGKEEEFTILYEVNE